MPVPGILNGKIPTAFIVVKGGAPKSAELLQEIERFSKVHLSERSTASEFRYIDSLPMTPVGKVDYRAREGMAAER